MLSIEESSEADFVAYAEMLVPNFLIVLEAYLKSTSVSCEVVIYLQKKSICDGSSVAQILTDNFSLTDQALLRASVLSYSCHVFRYVDDFLVVLDKTCLVPYLEI